MTTEDHSTDCRTEAGTTVGLIDAIITAARVLAARNLDDPAVTPALRDLRADPDVRRLINPAAIADLTGTIPCPKCGTACDTFDHTGVLCFDCWITFDTGGPNDVESALLDPDPVIQDWITRIRAAGWSPAPMTQREKANPIPHLPFPAPDVPPAPNPRPPLDVETPATWECPDCGRKSYRKTAAAARADITRQKNAAGHLALCRCPNIRRPIP